MRVTVLGTGIMGAAMARNLVRAGHEVTVWNRSRAKAEPLADDGATVASSAAEAVGEAEAVVTMLSDGAAVEDVMADDGALDALPDGAVWVQMSTVGVEATERLAELAADAGVAFVDAPVLGTRAPAEKGELTVLASGPDEALERVAPIFDAVGSVTRQLGEAGGGTRFKLVMNAWLNILNGGIAEVLTLARDLGFEPAQVLDGLEGAPLDAPYARMKGRLMVDGAFEPSFPLKHARKDARLALAASEHDLRLVRAAAELLEEAEALGYADEDMAAAICALAGIPARAD